MSEVTKHNFTVYGTLNIAPESEIFHILFFFQTQIIKSSVFKTNESFKTENRNQVITQG